MATNQDLVKNWYGNTLKRDADQTGLDYWSNQIGQNGQTAEQVYSKFLGSANYVAPGNNFNTDFTTASATAKQPAGNQTGVVDQWAQNIYGRAATDAENATYGGLLNSATNTQGVQDAYSQFSATGTPATGMDWFKASQYQKTPAELAAERSTQNPRDFMEGQHTAWGGTTPRFNPDGSNAWQFTADGTPKDGGAWDDQYSKTSLRDAGGYKYGLTQTQINDIYAQAGIKGPGAGHYGGNNNGTWMPDAGATDTLAARNARIAALVAAGVPAAEAGAMADNGFWMSEQSQFGADDGRIGGSGTGGGAGLLGGSGTGNSNALLDAAQSRNEQYGSVLNSPVDAPTETIEGRIQRLLADNNPVIRQAGDRAMEQFAARGLLNSSMAIEAANEAMIAKAIEIAGPDAQTYFDNRTNNVNAANKFASAAQGQDYDIATMGVAQTYAKELKALDQAYQGQSLDKTQSFALQQNYLQAVSNYETQYNTMLAAIQSSEMTATDKAAAVEGLTYNRDNNVRLITRAFESMPQWQDEWSGLVGNLPTGSAAEGPPSGVSVATGPAAYTDEQVSAAIAYASANTDYMTDAQWAAWSQDLVRRGLITQAELDAANGAA